MYVQNYDFMWEIKITIERNKQVDQKDVPVP
jgi:hypothetical protein